MRSLAYWPSIVSGGTRQRCVYDVTQEPPNPGVSLLLADVNTRTTEVTSEQTATGR